MFGAQATQASPQALAPVQSVTDRISEVFGEHMAHVLEFLVARGQLSYTAEGPLESIDNLDPAYADRMLADPKRFVAAVDEWVKGKEVAK